MIKKKIDPIVVFTGGFFLGVFVMIVMYSWILLVVKEPLL